MFYTLDIVYVRKTKKLIWDLTGNLLTYLLLPSRKKYYQPLSQPYIVFTDYFGNI